MYIVIEGQDGTGKDTQAKLLKDYFEKQGKNVVAYAESGTASQNEFISTIARLNYGSKQDIDHRTRVMLYLVNRYEQWRSLAEPALKNDGIVITTRNWFSTLIYEGYIGGVSKSLIVKLHKLMMPEPYFHPDKIILLTIDEKEQQKRLGIQTDKNWDRKQEVWKSQGLELQEKLNHAYLKVAKDYNIPTIDASGTIEEVHAEICRSLGIQSLGSIVAKEASADTEEDSMVGELRVV
ncbi:dTMP kinase [Candidatus Saccharibacteria bacterium]|nr:dTMP kinase [Candidatus Saccharibacteria bacterium]